MLLFTQEDTPKDIKKKKATQSKENRYKKVTKAYLQ